MAKQSSEECQKVSEVLCEYLSDSFSFALFSSDVFSNSFDEIRFAFSNFLHFVAHASLIPRLVCPPLTHKVSVYCTASKRVPLQWRITSGDPGDVVYGCLTTIASLIMVWAKCRALF